MRTFRFLLLVAFASGFCFGQPSDIAPIPPNPLELATGPAQVPATPAERAAVISLMDRAFENHSMHLRGTAPYALQVSFNASASTLYPGGSGSLQQTWVSGENWRWSATLDSLRAAAGEEFLNSLAPRSPGCALLRLRGPIRVDYKTNCRLGLPRLRGRIRVDYKTNCRLVHYETNCGPEGRIQAVYKTNWRWQSRWRF
jgi:hypothetical protein